MDKASSGGETTAMTFEEFSASVLRFESVVGAPRETIPAALVIDLLHLFATAADMLDVVKKAVFYGKPLDAEALSGMRFVAARVAYNLGPLVDKNAAAHRTPLRVPKLLPSGPVQNMRAFHALLGYCTEAGEIAAALRTSVLNDKPIDRVNIDEEFGDGDWYKAVWFDVTAQTQGATLRRVRDKLTTRYGDKPYSDKAALNRNLGNERAVLEEAAAAVHKRPGLNPDYRAFDGQQHRDDGK
jgi:hypothetical protein